MDINTITKERLYRDIYKFESGEKVIYSENNVFGWNKVNDLILAIMQDSCIDVTKEIKREPLHYNIRITGIKK